ncbi:MAG: ATP-binding protein [Ilumatobacteraceae bacterium]
MLVEISVALVIGIGVGAASGVAWSRRRSTSAPAPDAAATTPARAVDGDDVSSDLRLAVDHLDIGVVVVANTGEALYRNAAAGRFEGTHVGVLLDDHIASTFEEIADGNPVTRLVDLQGVPTVRLEVSANPTPDGGAVVIIRDVTELVRTDVMRTDFVTNISHELKTPVGAVAVLAEALIDEPDAEVVQRLAERLVEEAHRVVQTIDDLLRLSQIESAPLVDGVVDLNAVVQQAVARGRSVASGRGVSITTLDPVAALSIRGDERQLVSAVGNLVENAVKYSNEGGVVQVRTRVDANTVEVMVADQGIGIPGRDLDRIFERFYRVDRARSRETGGTGLGLSIVRHVASNHGGEVLVSSHEGEGSTFVLRLPAAAILETSAVDPDPDVPATSESGPHHE